MASDGFITPLPKLAARLTASVLRRARELHQGKPLRAPDEALAVNLTGLGFALQFSHTEDGDIQVTSLREPQAATVIHASPASLALQAGSGQPGGRVEISGDATLAQRWQQYFKQLNPDWERGLSERLGPVMGYQLARALQQFSGTTRGNTRHAGEMLGEYLQEESRLLVTQPEMQRFLDDVDDLAERTERLLARQASQ